MHSAKIKIINAQQAKLCTNYKNTMLKLLKTNATVWFNKILNILIIITLARLKNELPDDGHRPKHVGAF